MSRFVVALLLILTTRLAIAAEAFEEGKHYFLIDPAPLSIASPGKIEVTEVFSYGCPACKQFQPYMDKLAELLPPNAELHYVPASFRPDENWPLYQRAFLTAELLGIRAKSHAAMFGAVWGTGVLKPQTATLEDIAKFYAGYGTTAEEFLAAANSFGINGKMKQADAYLRQHRVDSTPTIIVAGKYRLTPASAGGWEPTRDLVLYLVKKESGP